MRDLLLLMVIVGAIEICSAWRSFPIETREKTEALFQTINQGITWDQTEELVGVAGRYSACNYLFQDGRFDVSPSLDKDGLTYAGLRDTYAGEEAHSAAVMKYIEDALQHWVVDEPYRSQIQRAQKFGCSVQPGCRERSSRSRQVSIACVFTPAYNDNGIQGEEPVPGISAKAFTPEQYAITEIVLGIEWDRSHYLENLSGTDTKCTMVNKKQHKYPHAEEEEREKGIFIESIFGSYPNEGSTQDAMLIIMDQWSKGQRQKIKDLAESGVGCSVIPDCMLGSKMYVVVSCLYSGDLYGDYQSDEPVPGIWAKAFTPEQYSITENKLRIVWDRSHYLENLSGKETDCSMIGARQDDHKYIHVKDEEKNREISINGIFGSHLNEGSTQDAMLAIMDQWNNKRIKKIKELATSGVGCSVIPDCKLRGKMYVVVACLYSADLYGSNQAEEPVSAIRAKAFTKEQYSLAVKNLGVSWDLSHYLENLSGRESACSMIATRGHQFLYAKEEAKREGITIGHLYGSSPNRGSTQDAMEAIMNQWSKKESQEVKKLESSGVGCSVIPDCMSRGQMYVVVTCLYSGDLVDKEQQDKPVPNPVPMPKARAFTKQQYFLTEVILGIEWDRKNHLENLSGKETDCSMATMTRMEQYPFLYVEEEKKATGKNLEGIFGSSVNKGSTEDAMKIILRGWSNVRGHKLMALTDAKVGCSIIPDCMYGNEMFVVISCVYSS